MEEIEKKPLIIIDGHALAYRSYYGMKQGFEPTIDGVGAGLVYGFCRGILSLIERYKSLSVIVSFDTPKPTHRHEKVAEYKAQRTKAPDDFYPQMQILQEFLQFSEIETLRCDGFESDDVIATICQQEQKKDKERTIIVLTGDHDLWQLINGNICILPLHGNLAVNKELNKESVQKKYEIMPEQIPFYKALCGDSSDNYKGVMGVGPKGAVQIIKRFETYVKMREHIFTKEITSSEKVLQKISASLDSADLCYEIAQLHYNAPCPWNEKPVNLEKARKWFEEKKLWNLGKKSTKLEKIFTEEKSENLSLFEF